MSESKQTVAVRLEKSLHDLVCDLAREQKRTPSNFIAQFLSVSLHKNMDRAELDDRMNPSMAMVRAALRVKA